MSCNQTTQFNLFHCELNITLLMNVKAEKSKWKELLH